MRLRNETWNFLHPFNYFHLGWFQDFNDRFDLSFRNPKAREVCLDWYGYRIDTKKAINDLNLKIETESELMAYCDFFKNVADTKK